MTIEAVLVFCLGWLLAVGCVELGPRIRQQRRARRGRKEGSDRCPIHRYLLTHPILSSIPPSTTFLIDPSCHPPWVAHSLSLILLLRTFLSRTLRSKKNRRCIRRG